MGKGKSERTPEEQEAWAQMWGGSYESARTITKTGAREVANEKRKERREGRRREYKIAAGGRPRAWRVSFNEARDGFVESQAS